MGVIMLGEYHTVHGFLFCLDNLRSRDLKKFTRHWLELHTLLKLYVAEYTYVVCVCVCVYVCVYMCVCVRVYVCVCACVRE